MSDLATLLDERAIQRGLSMFARALDERNFESLAEVFAADMTFDYGIGGEQNGLSSLCELVSHFLLQCGPTQHLLGSIIIDVDGDTATSRAYVQARHQRKDDPMGPVLDTNGEYVDQWQRRAEGWRIVRRDVLWQIFTGDNGILPLPLD